MTLPRQFAAALALLGCLSLARAQVPPGDPPVDYFGPVTFASAIATNVRLRSGTADITAGADLDGYFWGTGRSATTWSGGLVESYLQADLNSSITILGYGLSLTDLGDFFTGRRYNVTGFLLSGQAIDIDAFTYTGGAINVRSLPVSPVPEPETIALMLTGLAAVAAVGRRRQRRLPEPAIG